MAKRINWKARLPEIHPDVLKYLNDAEIKAMWSVAKDLHNGRITKVTEKQADKILMGTLRKTVRVFDMDSVYATCGSPLCIAGHVAYRLGNKNGFNMHTWYGNKIQDDYQLERLFSFLNPSKPKLAAKAIYRYLTEHNGEWPTK